MRSQRQEFELVGKNDNDGQSHENATKHKLAPNGVDDALTANAIYRAQTLVY